MAQKYRASFLFCPDCNNALMPNEDRAAKKLVYRCRICTYSKDADSSNPQELCVHRRDVSLKTKEDIIVNPNVIYDPSLAHSYDSFHCQEAGCKGREAVFFRVAEIIADDCMALIFVCTTCGQWRKEGKEDWLERTSSERKRKMSWAIFFFIKRRVLFV